MMGECLQIASACLQQEKSLKPGLRHSASGCIRFLCLMCQSTGKRKGMVRGIYVKQNDDKAISLAPNHAVSNNRSLARRPECRLWAASHFVTLRPAAMSRCLTPTKTVYVTRCTSASLLVGPSPPTSAAMPPSCGLASRIPRSLRRVRTGRGECDRDRTGCRAVPGRAHSSGSNRPRPVARRG